MNATMEPPTAIKPLAKDLEDFLKRYGKTLADTASKRLSPLHVPGVTPEPDMTPLERNRTKKQGKKFEFRAAQKEKIAGAVAGLKAHDSCIFVCDCGSGKTVMALGAAYAVDPNLRAIVLCPPHLVHKWVREAQWLIPGVLARGVKRLHELNRFVKDARVHKGPVVMVMGFSAAKLGYDIDRPCAAGRLKWMTTWLETPSEKKKGDRNFRSNQIQNQYGGYVEHGFLVERVVEIAVCPDCGQELTISLDGVERPIPLAEYTSNSKKNKRNYQHCNKCGVKLATSARGKVAVSHRPHLDRYIQRKLNGFFKFFIADEIHELASPSTCQGNAFGTLAASCKYTLALTGTLIGGKAVDLHATLWRLCADKMIQRGFDLTRYRNSRIGAIASNMKMFTHRYGVTEYKVERSAQDEYKGTVKRGRTGRKKDFRGDAIPKPGISPHLFNHFLLDRAVFMSLDELGPALPRLDRELISIPASGDLHAAYKGVDMDFKAALANGKHQAGGPPPMLASLRVTTLDAYLDRPWGWQPITVPGPGGTERLVTHPEDLGENHEDTKDRKLVEVVQRELATGRKCAVYVMYTKKRDAQTKACQVLKDAGIRAMILPASVKTTDREKWIEDHGSEMDVLVVQPRKVMTGLDLIQFPTIIWYQLGFSTHVLRQASARARRPIQTQDCKIVFLYYEDTVQEAALALMGEKEAASQALEGTFDLASLRALLNGGEDDDILGALANSLDGKKRAKESWLNVTVPEVQPKRTVAFTSCLSSAFRRKPPKREPVKRKRRSLNLGKTKATPVLGAFFTRRSK